MSTDEQPLALRLADWCEENSSGIYRPSAEAAGELRRLHAVEQDLLYALREIASSYPKTDEGETLAGIARAAIAKATGKEE